MAVERGPESTLSHREMALPARHQGPEELMCNPAPGFRGCFYAVFSSVEWLTKFIRRSVRMFW